MIWGREFDNVDIDLFCDSKRIKREYSTPRTPQQNGGLKGKIESSKMARVMFHMHDTPF